MTGAEAKAAFERADKLRLEGKVAEALQVLMLPSDRAVIEKRIAEMATTRKGSAWE